MGKLADRPLQPVFTKRLRGRHPAGTRRGRCIAVSEHAASKGTPTLSALNPWPADIALHPTIARVIMTGRR